MENIQNIEDGYIRIVNYGMRDGKLFVGYSFNGSVFYVFEDDDIIDVIYNSMITQEEFAMMAHLTEVSFRKISVAQQEVL